MKTTNCILKILSWQGWGLPMRRLDSLQPGNYTITQVQTTSTSSTSGFAVIVLKLVGGSHVSNILAYLLNLIFRCWYWRLKIVNNLSDNAEGSALHGFLIRRMTWASPPLLSSSLDYGHLLNYFLETNLFFNLRQMAIWPTVIAPFPLSPCDDLLQQMLNRIRPAD